MKPKVVKLEVDRPCSSSLTPGISLDPCFYVEAVSGD